MTWIENIAPLIWRFLVAQSIYAAIIFGVVAVAAFLLRKSPVMQLTLWSLVLLRFVLPPDLSQPLSIRNLVDFKSFEQSGMGFESAEIITAEGAIFTAADDGMSVQQNALPLWMTIALAAWTVGVALFSLLFFLRRRKWSLLAKRALPINDDSMLRQLQKLQQNLKIDRNVDIRVSNKVKSPFTIGVLRPVIVFPAALFSGSGRTVITSAMAHELVHIKRYDDLRLVFQNIIQIIFFFHPAIWLANHFIYIARECVCDSMAITAGKLSPQTYGFSLLASLKSPAGPHAAVLPAFTSPAAAAKRRILFIKKGYAMKRHIFYKLSLLLIAVFLLPMAGQTEQAATTPAAFFSPADNSAVEFILPLPSDSYRVTMGYGEHLHPILNKKRFHPAVDLAARLGTDVYASASGIVRKAVSRPERKNGYGNYIEIEHSDGFVTVYTHLNSVDVKAGQAVKQGEVIGAVGNTGKSTGPHLHFEIWKNGEHVNPADYIAF